jgi:hypothetical protein
MSEADDVAVVHSFDEAINDRDLAALTRLLWQVSEPELTPPRGPA